MVICPRCESQVDETVRTTCPLCFTPISPQPDAAQPNASPLNAAPPAPGMQSNTPQPNAPLSMGSAPTMPPAAPGQVAPLGGYAPVPQPAVQPVPAQAMPSQPMPTPVAIGGSARPVATPVAAPRAMGANQVMTLGGDIIDAPTTTSSQPAVGNSQYQAKPAYGQGRRIEEAPAKSGSGPLVPVLVVLALAGAGFGGWYFWMHRTNPKDQAQKFLTSFKTLDMKGIYETSEVDPEKYKDEKEFVDKSEEDLTKSPGGKDLATQMFSGIDFSVGTPKYSGMTEATVPVNASGTINLNFAGRSLSRQVSSSSELKMKNIGGIWKVSRDQQKSGGMLGSMGSLLGAPGGAGR